MSKKKITSINEMMKLFEKGEKIRRDKNIEEGRLERLKVNEPKKDRSPSPPPKKTKKQLALEAKEEKENKEREILEKEAMEKQLMALKKFEPDKYNEIMGLSKPDTKNEELKKEKEYYENKIKNTTSKSQKAVYEGLKEKVEKEIKEDKPKKINIKKGNKAKKQLEAELREKDIDIEKEHKKLLKEQKRLSTEKDLGKIMKGEAELLKKGKKYSVDTKLDVKKGLNKTIKNALKKSILAELEKAIEGSGIYYDSDSSSDSDSDESIDKEELKNYSRVLKHLLSHIEDPKEKPDKKDYKDAKRLIDNMKKVKRKVIKGRGDRAVGKTPDKYNPKPEKIEGVMTASKEGAKTITRRRGMSYEQQNRLNEIERENKRIEELGYMTMIRKSLNDTRSSYRGNKQKQIDDLVEKNLKILDNALSRDDLSLGDRFVKNQQKINELEREYNELEPMNQQLSMLSNLGLMGIKDPFEEDEKEQEDDRKQEGTGIKKKRGRGRPVKYY